MNIIIFAICLSFSLDGISAFSSNDWYYENWCGSCRSPCLKYLDDAYCVKKFPGNFSRHSFCPISVLSEPPTQDGYVSDKDFAGDNGFQYMNKLPVDTSSLSPYVTNGVNLCLIVTRRVKAESEKLPSLYNKYFCAGESSRTDAFETWSSSKIFAMANAGGHLRTNESMCRKGPIGPGLDCSVTESKHGKIPLGDLSTIICSYDHTAGYTSNSLSSYFHDIGWRDNANALVNSWLGSVDSAMVQSLGGNYGEATPSDLGFVVSPPRDDAGRFECPVDKDPWPQVYSNSLSVLSAAEMARRIIQHDLVSQNNLFSKPMYEFLKCLNAIAVTSRVEISRSRGRRYQISGLWSHRLSAVS